MADISEGMDFNKMKIAELRAQCKKQGVDSTGKKQELVERLQGLEDETVLKDDDVLNDILTSDPVEAEDPTHDDDEAILQEPTEQTNGKTVEEEEVPAESSPTTLKRPSSTEASDATSPKITRIEMPKELTDQEKKALRAQKFGADSAKKESRAERFGLSAAGTTSSGQLDKLKQRAERFGVNTNSTLVKSADGDKLAKRKERFGASTGGTASTTSSSTSQAILDKRAARFGMAK